MTLFRWSALMAFICVATIVIECAGHGQHGAVRASDGEAIVCPVCRMDASPQWYLQLNYGQKIYTCDMISGQDFRQGTKYYSQPSLLGLDMKKSITDKGCDNSVANKSVLSTVMDPMSGDAVTETNVVAVCLQYGQKIYFASNTSRKLFVDGVSSTPFFAVDKSICNGVVCPDNKKVLSEATTAVPMITPASSQIITSDLPIAENSFCTGASVMFSGFQSTVNGACVRLLFQPFVLNSVAKYVVGFIGVMLLPVLNEFLVQFREKTRKRFIQIAKTNRPTSFSLNNKHVRKLILTILYMLQMTIAYFAMLVVMIYDIGLFVALILGFGIGFMCFKSVDRNIKPDEGLWRYNEQSPVIVLEVSEMMCMANCGNTVQNAILNVNGVKHVYIEFEKKLVYVNGTATVNSVVEAVESVGFQPIVKNAPINGAYGSVVSND